MAFVNEYISEDDIKKYGIREIWAKFRSNTNGKSNRTQYDWTIDKERDIFFISAKSGREDKSNEIIAILWWRGIYLSVTLAKIGGELDFRNRIGSVLWEFRGIWKPEGFNVLDEEIIPILKEALVAYQLDGVEHPMVEYKVNFNF